MANFIFINKDTDKYDIPILKCNSALQQAKQEGNIV